MVVLVTVGYFLFWYLVRPSKHPPNAISFNQKLPSNILVSAAKALPNFEYVWFFIKAVSRPHIVGFIIPVPPP